MGAIMKEDTVFLIHPDTKGVFTVKETAMLLGITTGAVYSRIKLGDIGKRLWRPKGTKMEATKPGNPTDLSIIKCYENEKLIL